MEWNLGASEESKCTLWQVSIFYSLFPGTVLISCPDSICGWQLGLPGDTSQVSDN